MVCDKLFINNVLYVPDEAVNDPTADRLHNSHANHQTSPKAPSVSDTPPSKRQRHGSSPQHSGGRAGHT